MVVCVAEMPLLSASTGRLVRMSPVRIISRAHLFSGRAGADIGLWEFKHPRVHAVQLMYVSFSDKMIKYLPILISYVFVSFDF